MRKNNKMGLTAVFLAAVLVMTSVISGTYAKMVRGTRGSDNARTAEYGVSILVEGSLFPENLKVEPGMRGCKSVPSAGGEGFVVITLSGTAETAVELTASALIEDPYGEIGIPAGCYHVDYGERTVRRYDTEELDEHDSLKADTKEISDKADVLNRYCIALEEAYYPITYTVYQKSGTSFAPVDGCTDMEVDGLQQWLEETYGSEATPKVCEAGYDFAGFPQYGITWEWKTEKTGKNQSWVNAADTMLMFGRNGELKWLDEEGPAQAPEDFHTEENMILQFQIRQAD